MPSRRDLLAATAAASASALAGCARERRVTGDWPRAGYDDRNTGFAPDSRGPGADPTTRWTATIPEGLYVSSPVLHGDRVLLGYATSSYREGPRRVGLRLLDAATGENRRDVTVTEYTGEPTGGALYRDSVVVADGAVYLLSFDGLYSFTPSGDERWHADLGGGPANSIQRSGHPVVAEETVFAPTASTTWHTDAPEAIYALDADTGEKNWRYEVPVDDYGWTFPPAYADGVLYVAALEYGVVALDAESGDVLWHTPMAGVNGPPTLADGRVFVSLDPDDSGEEGGKGNGSDDDGADAASVSHVVALDAATGEENWRTTGEGSWLGRRVSAARGRVYHRENLRDFVARDAATGEEVWRYADAEHVQIGQAAVTNDALYVGVATGGDDDSAIAVLDPETGAEMGLATLGTTTGLDASVALSDGLAVVTSSAGRVYAFEPCSLGVAGHCLY